MQAQNIDIINLFQGTCHCLCTKSLIHKWDGRLIVHRVIVKTHMKEPNPTIAIIQAINLNHSMRQKSVLGFKIIDIIKTLKPKLVRLNGNKIHKTKT